MVEYSRFKIAYFSMEIGIDQDIPTYSGGLGVLAGDTLRSAADLGLPMIGITLLYRKGYFKQKIVEGNQQEEYIGWDIENRLIELPNKVKVKIEGRDVFIRCWMYTIRGAHNYKVPIIFLDTDLEENAEWDRTLTDHLYGGDRYYRLCQEAILGIGGTRMLHDIGWIPDKYHMNEGHSALLALELCRMYKDLPAVRRKCVFTTHTPVPAGHDQFEMDMARKVLNKELLDHACEDIWYNGALNMTYIGLRFSKFINGVAKRHGEISQHMFPNFHIESITNGIHAGYWTSRHFKDLYEEYIPGWYSDPASLRYVLSIPKTRVWEAHMHAKKELMALVNERYDAGMDENIFTIGFARRAATYKRAELIFSDMDRLKRIGARGIQIIFGGKAHPNDGAGKEIIKRISEHMKDLGGTVKACYIENYDLEVAKKLIPGVDLWLNTPQRPKEASGTSGMKAAVNGVPQLSILDGWWIEGHIEGTTGWSIGPHPHEHIDCDNCVDSEDLYKKLEYNILPLFYENHEGWVDVMRHAIAINGSFFNTHRMLQQYVMNAYFK
ncbi:alpha-glucan family phosphorylase [Candidatus Woesearchaeota archaeon]|nr:alpha-glucan family phosphorylase [Candidatus Woesearchaeota archaeon]